MANSEMVEQSSRRRERYATDDDFREAERERVRSAYWDTKGGSRPSPCREALIKGRLDGFGVERNIIDPSSARGSREVTFTMSELSAAMGKAPSYVMRQVGKAMWPRPQAIVSETEFNKSPTYVYTSRQARAMIRVFAKHEETFSYYRTGHTRTRDALFRTMENDA